MKFHQEEDQATHDFPPREIICVDEISLLGLEFVVDCPGDMIIQNEGKGLTELPGTDIVWIHEAEVSGLIWIDAIELFISGLGEGGHFVAHKPPG